MIDFKAKNDILVLIYKPANDGMWLIDKFKHNETYNYNHTFYLTKNHLVKKFDEKLFEEQGELHFKFGILIREYYKINKDIMGIENNLYIHKKIQLKRKLFVAYDKISIFKHIDSLIKESIYLGGNNRNAISYQDFEKLLSQFPNTTERKKYCSARLSAILAPYFEKRTDAIEKYEKYMKRKKSIQGQNLLEEFSSYEKDKFTRILEKLKNMLKNETKYIEIQWQREIIEIIQLIFPKYIKAFEKVKIKDYDSDKTRELDYLLVDSEGHIDIVELKRPFLNCSVISKNTYRDNHYPVRELSGSVMQVEKYLLYLNKWGKIGERCLNKRYENNLPQNFKIKIINPGAMIILGRDNDLDEDQKKDFEIVKRKYKNIIDIITYDDLIRRLQFIISQYESQEQKVGT